jgi:hypothetical protein
MGLNMPAELVSFCRPHGGQEPRVEADCAGPYTLPCQPLVPDFLTTLITRSELRPYSASTCWREHEILQYCRVRLDGGVTDRSLPSPPLTLNCWTGLILVDRDCACLITVER